MTRNTTDLFRIAVVGTKGANRRYLTRTAGEVSFGPRPDALHWSKTEATLLADGLNLGLAQQGRPERLQIENAQ